MRTGGPSNLTLKIPALTCYLLLEQSDTYWALLGCFPKDDRLKRKNASPNLHDQLDLNFLTGIFQGLIDGIRRL